MQLMLASELNAKYVNLRFSKAKNGQIQRTRDASEYRDPWRMFAPAAGAGEATTSIGTVAEARPHSSADRAAAF
jgi:hypothetical protein